MSWLLFIFLFGWYLTHLIGINSIWTNSVLVLFRFVVVCLLYTLSWLDIPAKCGLGRSVALLSLWDPDLSKQFQLAHSVLRGSEKTSNLRTIMVCCTESFLNEQLQGLLDRTVRSRMTWALCAISTQTVQISTSAARHKILYKNQSYHQRLPHTSYYKAVWRQN